MGVGLVKIQHLTLKGFYKYGVFLAKHPVWFLLIPIGACCALAPAFLKHKTLSDIAALYAPKDSRAISDNARISQLPFSPPENYELDYTSYKRVGYYASFIAKSRVPKAIFDDKVLDDLKNLIAKIKAISVKNLYFDKNEPNHEEYVTYAGLCQKTYFADCFVEGEILATSAFKESLNSGLVTYPLWKYENMTLDMRRLVGDVSVTPEGILTSAGVIQIKFWFYGIALPEWKEKYEGILENHKSTLFETAYAYTSSLDEEIDRSTQGDIKLFTMTFILMVSFTAVATMGGDCISTRVLLSFCGIVSVVLGIGAAMGTVTLLGVNFIEIAAIAPFLCLGIGVDDMFVLMNSWSETLHMTQLSIPERIGATFRSASVGIVITSVTDFVAFLVGSSSQFRSVQNFCMYAAFGVLFCYLCNITMFGACLTIHARRVYSGRHTLTCRKALRDDRETQGGGFSCHNLLCTGRIPDRPGQEQSLCEKGPKGALLRYLMWTPIRIFIFIIFAVYLGVAAWGCTKLDEGLQVIDLVMESSYFYKYRYWDEEYFGFKVPVTLITVGEIDYLDPKTLQDTRDLFAKLEEDRTVDSYHQTCWLFSFADSAFFNTSLKSGIAAGLQDFLKAKPEFSSDVLLDETRTSIIASRCYIVSTSLIGSGAQKRFMLWTREVADASQLGDVIAYSDMFETFEQYVIILRSTMKTVGLTLLVMFVVTLLFLSHPMIIAIVMLQIILVLVGVFGFMALWGISLNAVSMIILIMSNGFSVDFCAHVCAAYMISKKETRQERSLDAVTHSSGPILNGGVSSLLGVVTLYFSESYPFRTFFKMMLLVIVFGVAHAIFLVPVVLSFIGPKNHSTALYDVAGVQPEIDMTEADQPNEVEDANNPQSSAINLPNEFIDVNTPIGSPHDSRTKAHYQ